METAPVPAAPEDLVERASRVLAERFGTADWRPIPSAISARKSTIRLLESARMGRQVALKCYANPLACSRQAAALRHGAALGAAGERYDVPDLYAEFGDAHALLVEWVPTPHLEQVLVRAAASPAAHWRAVCAAGAWLRRFHALDRIGEGRLRADRYQGALEARLAASPAAAAVLAHDRLWQQATRALEQALRAVDGAHLPEALGHGDFTSTNILVGSGRVTGIDVWAELRLPVAEDLARMFVYLAMGDLQPLLGRVLAMAPARRRAQQALFEGYGEDLCPAEEPWRALVLYEILARWLAIEERLQRRGNFPESWKRGGLRALLRGMCLG